MDPSTKTGDPRSGLTIPPRMARRPQSNEERKANAALGKRIALLRKQRGFTQVELAERLGVIQSVISSYEVGRVRPSPEAIVKICESLDLTADQLLGRAKTSKAIVGAGGGDVLDRRFVRRLRLLKKLPKRDQDALLRTIDAFIQARSAS